MKATSASTKKKTLEGGRRIEYLPLEDIQSAARNPKNHAETDLDKSVGRFGYTEPLLLDERTGRLVAGHGRLAALQRIRAKGEAPPDGVQAEGGAWLVPVVRGWASRSDQEAEAYLLASNQLTIAGGWDDDALEAMLRELHAADALDGVGWAPDELEKLLDDVAGGTAYTEKIESPVYKPTGAKPSVSELYDTEKLHALLQDIDAAEDISNEERVFLRMAAQRHVVFDYQSIAEFYAHAPAHLQQLMEKSALVIIDFKQALENGFVKLTEALASQAATEEGQE